MDYQNSAQLYTQSAVNIGVRQQLQRKGASALFGGVVLWRKAGWLLLVIIPIMLSINIFMVSALQSIDTSIVQADGVRHELMDARIGLLAKRAGMLVPEHLEQAASVKLSLYRASKRQVGHFNRRTGNFNYL
jgi:hypothetical protein